MPLTLVPPRGLTPLKVLALSTLSSDSGVVTVRTVCGVTISAVPAVVVSVAVMAAASYRCGLQPMRSSATVWCEGEEGEVWVFFAARVMPRATETVTESELEVVMRPPKTVARSWKTRAGPETWLRNDVVGSAGLGDVPTVASASRLLLLLSTKLVRLVVSAPACTLLPSDMVTVTLMGGDTSLSTSTAGSPDAATMKPSGTGVGNSGFAVTWMMAETGDGISTLTVFELIRHSAPPP